MTQATIGTSVSSTNGNTSGHNSLAVTLATTTVGEMNVIQFHVLTPSTADPTVATPTGWTRVLYRYVTASASVVSAVYYKVYDSSDAAGSVTSQNFGWTNAGQAMAFVTQVSNFDPASPIPYELDVAKSGSNTTYAISGATGTDSVTLFYGSANKTGSATYTGLVDNPVGLINNSASLTAVGRYVSTELAPSTAWSKSMTGANTSVGTVFGFGIKGASSASQNASITVTGATDVTISGSASSALTVTVTGATDVAVNTSLNHTTTVAVNSVNTVVSVPATPAIAWLYANSPQWIAHRGGYASTLGEETLEAYTAAATRNKNAALEISVWQCSTGEWVCSHDQTTGRVFSGTSLDIPSNTWSTLSTKTSINGGNSIRRMTDILTALPGRIFVIDNKNVSNMSALISVLEGAIPGQWIAKNYFSGYAWPNAASAVGAPCWLFFYPTDLSSLSTTWTNLAPARAAGVPIIYGFGDYNTAPVPTTSDTATFMSFLTSNGVWGSWAHILATTAQKTTADSQATSAGRAYNGYMVQGFSTVVPQTGQAGGITSTGVTTVSIATLESILSLLTSAGQTTVTLTALETVASLINSAGASTLTVSTLETLIGLLASSGTTTISINALETIVALVSSSGTTTISISVLETLIGLISSSGSSTVSVAAMQTVVDLLTSTGSTSVIISVLESIINFLVSTGVNTTSIGTLRLLTALITSTGTNTVILAALRTLTALLTTAGTTDIVLSNLQAITTVLSYAGGTSLSIAQLESILSSFNLNGANITSISIAGQQEGLITADGTTVLNLLADLRQSAILALAGNSSVSVEALRTLLPTLQVSGASTLVLNSTDRTEAVISLSGTNDAVFAAVVIPSTGQGFYIMSESGPESVFLVGYYDGSQIQPATLVGVWDGSQVIPL